ncbi:MAG TPA: ester cyclase [Actinomycetota bacterium]|nr:ester cyclase [Actinomycetota bacterium]
MASQDISKDVAEDLKRRVERGFNERNPSLIEGLLADRLMDHNVLLGGIDLRQRLGRVLEAIEDATLSIDDYIFQGNAIAWQWTIEGTHSKRLLTYEPTGRKISVSGLSAAVLQNGKVVQHWEFSDDAHLQAQLEASLASG